jgi:hypothetical protein
MLGPIAAGKSGSQTIQDGQQWKGLFAKRHEPAPKSEKLTGKF